VGRRYFKYITPILFIPELLLLNLSFIGAYRLVFNSWPSLLVNYQTFFIVINLAWLLLHVFFRLYEVIRVGEIKEFIRRISLAFGLHALFTFSCVLFSTIFFLDDKVLFWTYFFFGLSLFVLKIGFLFVLKFFRTKGFNIRRVIILGYNGKGKELFEFFTSNPEYGYVPLGFFDSDKRAELVLGSLKDVYAFAKEKLVDEIYYCLPDTSRKELSKWSDFAEENLIQLKIVSQYSSLPNKYFSLVNYDNIPVINISPTPLSQTMNLVIKRSFDIVFSSMVIVLFLSWILPILALFIKLESRGPVFYFQKRHGKDNKEFTCFKLRTMFINTDPEDKQAQKNDPRITRVGALLRKSSLDELPQFFNVFLGQMSIVGPRPHPLPLNEKYIPVIKKYNLRHYVKPGITGLAQARGYRGETATSDLMERRVNLDIYYLKNWSILLDLKIIFLTVFSIFNNNEKAY
jgi:putative colanic acid biosysnthesis UDP-glucose lipid carrier transferase